jgi:flagellar protein FliL
MAKAAAATTSPEAAKKGASMVVQIGLLVALTGVAVGAGWVSGMMLGAQAPEPPAKAAIEDETKTAEGEAAPPPPNLLMLEPITTNLASPAETWGRIEVALVFDGVPDDTIADTIHQDFLAYLRTVRLAQIEGASGFQHLRSDLEERAGLRSDGRVKRVLIRTMLFE